MGTNALTCWMVSAVKREEETVTRKQCEMDIKEEEDCRRKAVMETFRHHDSLRDGKFSPKQEKSIKEETEEFLLNAANQGSVKDEAIKKEEAVATSGEIEGGIKAEQQPLFLMRSTAVQGSGSQNQERPQRSQDGAHPTQRKKSKRTSCYTEQRVQPKPHPCERCGKAFTNKSGLNRHQKVHSVEKPFSCDECGKGFILQYLLKRHKVIHAGEKSHTCAECGKAFAVKDQLAQHQTIHKKIKPYGCVECGKTFRLTGTLRQHLLLHRGIKPYKCEECGKAFRQRTNFLIHLNTHSRAQLYRCDRCGKIYKQKKTLTAHLRSHTGHEVHRCNACDKVFTTYQYLKHHQLSHSSARPYKCDTCGKLYKHNFHLNRHQQLYEKKALRCDQDWKSFRGSSRLRGRKHGAGIIF